MTLRTGVSSDDSSTHTSGAPHRVSPPTAPRHLAPRSSKVSPSGLLGAGIVLLTIAVTAGYSLTTQSSERARALPVRSVATMRFFDETDPVRRACSLGAKVLRRIRRGYHGNRSEDITMVPVAPNYPGSFALPGHSGPWNYLQRVPLVLYGPRRIRAAGLLRQRASITDVYPTVGELLDVPLERRAGGTLHEALERRAGLPKLVVQLVWDGVGRNVLDRWPGSWPTLRRLEREGTSYLNATVGSSPSITPATHANLGTGTFPRVHGITSIPYRKGASRIQTAFARRDPSDLERTTYADDIDLAFGNMSRVGLLGWKEWHLGMLGHGSLLRGADRDELALIGNGEKGLTGNGAYFRTPSYLRAVRTLGRRAAELDRADGELDGDWMGRPILRMHDNPAWVRYESDLMMTMLRRGDYGTDAVPDLLFVNFKVSDIVGHQHTMDSLEMRRVLRAQDAALGRLVRYLEREVRDYVLILTADHGHVPSPERTGAWPIGIGSVRSDLDRHFGVPRGRSLTAESGPTGLFLDRRVTKSLGITPGEVARFLNDYTISENWGRGRLPEGYEGRGEERVFAAAFPSAASGAIARCASGA
jgi:hypothetical protein